MPCFRNVFTSHKGFNDSPPWQTCRRGRFSDNNIRPHPIVNGSEKRLRIALRNMDYVTSFELPFRLLLTRIPQLIAALREEWGISQKNVVFNDKRFGCVYSLKASLSGVPDTYRYHLSHRIRRVVGNENTSLPYQQIAREVKAPRERLKYALEAGLLVTALDGLFWSGSQRIAADVLRLRKAGMPVVATSVEECNERIPTL
ncbi:DNA-binding protein [Escherichia coli]|uniref:DNA-binding protein n=1 Tax=Escherichia coli TaxID=562 RepID=A0AAP6AXZ0_ECOLX|nr:DNA-binding protein [Escherichia coli]EED1845364.1 DNA-binding protein [Escherichia coli]EEZ1594890.1 DNA-binding protein [Escherichia coli]EIT9645222.1 DNA-binding protein [Escherichia coli]ELP0840200.1 DNA-binding protein [Escherichia coli]MCX8308340.1 DNA-binding protein [Escherichia coli]